MPKFQCIFQRTACNFTVVLPKPVDHFSSPRYLLYTGESDRKKNGQAIVQKGDRITNFPLSSSTGLAQL